MLCPLSAQRLRSTDFILFGNPQDPTKLNKKWERKGMGSENSQIHSKLCVRATLNGKKHKPRWACTQIFHLKGRRHPWSWTAGHQQRTEAVVKVDSASQRRRRRIKLWKPLTLLSRHPKVLWGHALLDLDAGALHSIVSSGVTRFWIRIRHGKSSRPRESVVPQQQLFWFQTSGPEYSYMCWGGVCFFNLVMRNGFLCTVQLFPSEPAHFILLDASFFFYFSHLEVMFLNGQDWMYYNTTEYRILIPQSWSEALFGTQFFSEVPIISKGILLFYSIK